jgi:hypothetical protein
MIRKTWNSAMQFDAALGAALDWKDAIRLLLDLGDAPVADMWLSPGVVDGYEFVPLRCVSEIAEEARAMENCVRTCGGDVAHHRSRLWSVHRDGVRVATLEVGCPDDEPLLNIRQIKAKRNRDAPKDVAWAARCWLHAHDLPGIATAPLAWDDAVLDRGAWISLWKPYWLAKRHIPLWLPLAPSRDALSAL